MKLRSKIALATALIICAVNAHSEESGSAPAKLQVPAGPLLRSAADFSRWEISFSYPQSHQKNDCLVFVLDGAAALDGGDQQQALEDQKTIAYIDAETRLPVLLRINGETRKFQFDAPPTAMLTLPEEIADQVKKGEEARTRL